MHLPFQRNRDPADADVTDILAVVESEEEYGALDNGSVDDGYDSGELAGYDTDPAPIEGFTPLNDDDDESWLAPDRRRKVRLRLPVFMIGLFIVIGGGFWGGAVVDKHFGTTNTASAAGAATAGAARRTAGEGAASFGAASAEGFTAAKGGTGARSFTGANEAAPAASGTISAISGDTLTVKTTSGSSVKVTISSKTVVSRSGKGSPGNLTVGDTVTVEGTKSDGTVSATAVTATTAGTSTSEGAGFSGLSDAGG